MKSSIQKFSENHFVGLKYFVVSLWILSSFLELNAQFIPAFCNESPGARWTSYMDWIKPTAPVTNGLVFSIQKYNLGSIGLKSPDILTNTHNLISTGNVSFIIADRVGNSCLKEKNISLRNPLNCTTQLVKISGQFGQGGNPLPNPGYITLNGELYKYQASSGDIHTFKREGVNELLLMHIKKTSVN